MNGRSSIGKKCTCSVRIQSELVFDRRAPRSVLPCVDQDVRSDLRERGLEQDEVAIVGPPAGSLAKQLHRVVKRLQTIVKAGEGGVELKWLTLWVRSQ